MAAATAKNYDTAVRPSVVTGYSTTLWWAPALGRQHIIVGGVEGALFPDLATDNECNLSLVPGCQRRGPQACWHARSARCWRGWR